MADSDTSKSQQPGHDSGSEDSATESEKQSKIEAIKSESADPKENPAAEFKQTIVKKASSQEEPIHHEETEEFKIYSELSPVERMSEDKSSPESKWKVKGAVGLVEKFRRFKSPKRTDTPGGSSELMVDSGVSESPPHDEKSQSPKKMEQSPSRTSDVSHLPMTNVERMGELSPPKLEESGPSKTSPLKSILDKCKDMIDTAKKVGQNIKQPFLAKAEKEKSLDSQCSECTRIRNTPHENLSFDSECGECRRMREMPSKTLIQTMFDKTKGFFSRVDESEIESSIDLSPKDMHQRSIDTFSSGVLGDVSGNIETRSSTSTSPDTFTSTDHKDKPTLARLETVVEVNPQPPKPASPLVKRVKDKESHKSSDVNLDVTPQRKTPPLKRQQHIQEKDPIDPSEDYPFPSTSGIERIPEQEIMSDKLLPKEKQSQYPSNETENPPDSVKDETGKRSAEFDSESCSSPLKKQNTKE